MKWYAEQAERDAADTTDPDLLYGQWMDRRAAEANADVDDLAARVAAGEITAGDAAHESDPGAELEPEYPWLSPEENATIAAVKQSGRDPWAIADGGYYEWQIDHAGSGPEAEPRPRHNPA